MNEARPADPILGAKERALVFVLTNESRSSVGVALTLAMLGAAITEWVSTQRYLTVAIAVAVLNVASALVAASLLKSIKLGAAAPSVRRRSIAQILLSGFGGAVWGFAPILLGVSVNAAPNAVIVIFQAALLTMTTISMGTDRIRYLAFSLPLVLAAAVSNVVMGGRLQLIVAAGMIVFGVFLQGLQRQIGNTFSENIALSEELRKLAKTDALTGIVNRHGWNEVIAQLLGEGEGDGGGDEGSKGFAILVADVDRFKLVNDTFGHDAGDRALVSVAQRLASVVKSTDVIARLGGDEFGVVLRNVMNEIDLASVVARIEKHLLHDFVYEGVSLPIAVSFGAALCHANQLPSEVLALADRNMFENKRNRQHMLLSAETSLTPAASR